MPPGCWPCSGTCRLVSTLAAKRLIEPGHTLLHGTGGTAEGASSPSISPEPHHASRPPPACTRSRSGHSGRRMADKGRSTACRNEGWRSRVAASREESLYFLSQILEGRLQGSLPGLHHHRPAWSKSAETQTDCLAEPAADAIPHHAAAERPGSGKPYPGPGSTLHLQANRREVGPRCSKPLIVYLAELGPLSEPGVFGPGVVLSGAFDQITWPCGQLSRS